ncbi:WD40 repeat-like protein [Cylindrobasidium torrendii FP15055 ss-10]|uniref:WD40 repeat-like protein n=1 Tax=Cylindrobasidium torrendii FP15055 ss-10 TaxID=1314674 RepID=A0A0D7BK82_9AGAR|nr:WD40 repeat-like protein [Cylindrobasidium torrendii FP15055 ss-10]
MDFTEIYKQTNSLVSFSPGGHFILAAVQDRIVIRRTDSCQIARTVLLDATPSPTQAFLQKTTPETRISHAAWSSDSECFLAACAKKGFVRVYKLYDEEWDARIDAGAEGLVKAEWSPDGRYILCFSEWGLRVTIWSLVSGKATYIQFPVHPDRGYAFRADGRYFLLAERHKSKDTLGIYDAHHEYQLVRQFPLPTASLASLSLSPTGANLAIWEGILEYKLHVLTPTGTHLKTFTPEPEPGLGIRTVCWHPTGSFLLVGGWDDRIHVLDSLSWSCILTLELSSRIPSGVNVWREPANWLERTEGRGFLSYERLQSPYTLLLNRVDHTKPHPKCGIVQIEFNSIGSLLMVRYETSSSAVHIYDFPSPSTSFNPRLRSILLHDRPVRNVRWNPARKGSLAICCGAAAIYTWSDEWVGEGGVEEEVAECVGVPADKFETYDIKWASDGKGLILLDKDAFCCAFEVEDE